MSRILHFYKSLGKSKIIFNRQTKKTPRNLLWFPRLPRILRNLPPISLVVPCMISRGSISQCSIASRCGLRWKRGSWGS